MSNSERPGDHSNSKQSASSTPPPPPRSTHNTAQQDGGGGPTTPSEDASEQPSPGLHNAYRLGALIGGVIVGMALVWTHVNRHESQKARHDSVSRYRDLEKYSSGPFTPLKPSPPKPSQLKPPRFDLRGPAPFPGLVISETSELAVSQALSAKSLALLRDGEQVEKFSATYRSAYVYKVLETVDRRISRYRQLIQNESADERQVAALGTNDSKTTSALKGQVVLWTFDGDVWTRGIEGNPTPSAAEKAALEALTPWISDEELYPAHPVVPGYRWKMQGERLIRQLGIPWQGATVKAAATDMLFERVVQHKGQRCALISATLAATIVSGEGERMELDLKATEYRSLDTRLSVDGTVTGSIEFLADQEVGRRKVAIVYEGNFTGKTSSEILSSFPK